MRHFRYFLGVLLISFYAQSSVAQCYYQVWSDEFNNSGAPSSTNWKHEVNGDGGGNNELQYYTDRLENAECSNGTLKITAKKESYQGKSYTSARIITYGKKSFKYGKIEARIKMPYGKGIWPAFWMLGNSIFSGTNWPNCGEIDIVEMVGGTVEDKVVVGTPHWGDANGNHAQYGGSKTHSEKLANDFHLYSIEWTPSSIKWFFDGVQYHVMSITPSDLSEFHKDFFILLNLAVGGNWPGSPDATTVFPQTMEVDYVRVYQDVMPKAKVIGSSVVNKGEEVTFSIDNPLANVTYNWTLPDGAVVKSGVGTSSIVATWGEVSGTVQCSAVSTCQVTTVLTPLSVSVVQKPEGDVYTVPLVTSGTSQWLVSGAANGVVVATPNEKSNLDVDFSFNGGTTNSALIHTLPQLLDLNDHSEIRVTLKVLSGAAPRNISIDMVGNDGAVDMNDSFTLTEISRKHNFITYSYKYNAQSAARSLDRIAKIILYINRGVSNLVTQGVFEISKVQLVNPNLVSDVIIPSGESYVLANVDSNSSLLWSSIVSDGNIITPQLNNLVVDVNWSVASQAGSKSLIYTFEKPIDVSIYNQLELKLSKNNAVSYPTNVAVTLIDTNGVSNSNAVWTISNFEQVNASGYLQFATGNSADGGEWLPQQIKRIEIKFNDGVTTLGNGDFTIESARLVKEPVNTSIPKLNSQESGIEIYPNPVTGTLNIDMSTKSGLLDVVVTDLSGNSIVQYKAKGGALNQIDVSQLQKGAYIVTIKSDLEVYAYTLLKK